MSKPIIIAFVICFLVLCAGSLLVSIEARAEPASVGLNGDPETIGILYKMVRVEYLDLDGNLPHTNSTCHIFNTSYTTPVVLNTVYVMTHQGLAVPGYPHNALVGTVIPPLGRFDFPVNSTIPGLLPGTNALANPYSTTIAASVVVGWSGGTDQTLELSATIERNATGDTDKRAHIQVEGYSITP